MNALYLTLFIGAVLTAYGLVQFAVAWGRREHDQNDRLSLLPLLADVEGPGLPAVPALATSSVSASASAFDNKDHDDE